MPAKDMASDEVVTASGDDSVGDIADRLRSENVGAVVVADGERPIGVVTDRDIVVALTDHDGVDSLVAEDIMTEDSATIHTDDEGMAISRAIDEHGVRRLPVVDDGSLVGIITLEDPPNE